MRVGRVISRLAILLIVGAAFVGLSAVYLRSADPLMPNARGQWEIRHQPSAPGVGYVVDFVGYAILLAMFAWLGRMLFRLRLNPAPRNEGKPILLALHETRRELEHTAMPPGNAEANLPLA